MKFSSSLLIAAVSILISTLPRVVQADTSFTLTNTVADAFLSGKSPALNFGAAGILAIAPASAAKGEFDSILMFNTATVVSQFNTTYGAGNWTIAGIMLSLASNYGTQGATPNNNLLNPVSGGNFGVDWLANNAWVEGNGNGNGAANGAVSYNSISSLFADGSDALGTYTYTPPGNNIYANYSLPLDSGLVSGTEVGGDVSLYFFAADNQVSYLFNSKEFTSNHPELTFTAAAVPEPGSLSLIAAAIGSMLLAHKTRRKAT